MRRYAMVLVALACGCFTTDLDPGQGGAFACSDEPGGECPDGLSCVNDRCEVDEDLPVVAIGFPEDGEDVFLGEGIEIGGTQTIGITVQGTLVLVPPGGDHVFGEGHLEISADGAAPVIVTSGAGNLAIDLPFANTVGAHRISVRAIRNDGTPYDHEDGKDNRLFWMSDGLGTTPLVGLKSPWPGSEFPLDATEIEIEVAVLNFGLQAVMENGLPQVGVGHIHVFYAEDTASCVLDPECDKGYLTPAIIGLDPPGVVTLPSSGAGSFPLGLALRNVNHSLYLFDPTPDEGPEDARPVVDEITVVRR